jgi:hypothetical protein
MTRVEDFVIEAENVMPEKPLEALVKGAETIKFAVEFPVAGTAVLLKSAEVR